jgi:hypothetical protein
MYTYAKIVQISYTLVKLVNFIMQWIDEEYSHLRSCWDFDVKFPGDSFRIDLSLRPCQDRL